MAGVSMDVVRLRASVRERNGPPSPAHLGFHRKCTDLANRGKGLAGDSVLKRVIRWKGITIFFIQSCPFFPVLVNAGSK